MITAWAANGRETVSIPFPVKPDRLVDYPMHIQDERPCDVIRHSVCEIWEVSMMDLLSERKHRYLVEPRWAGMLAASERTPYSLPRIGREFGGRDHTTVMYGLRKARQLLAGQRQPFTRLFKELESRL